MLGAWVPADVRPDVAGVDFEAPVAEVGFYVPAYMGTADTLEVMHDMPALQVVQLLTAGFDAALAHLPDGVTLCNAAGVHDASTAELAVGLILASLRGIDDFARAMPEGRWLYSRREALADKSVLIVGAGGVGLAIQRRLSAFEVSVVLVGRTPRRGVRGADALSGLLPEADVVVLAVPLAADTSGMVDRSFLGRMRDGALIVNVSRGGVVDGAALLAEVESGRLRAALDVTDPEPLPGDHPLWRAPGVLISPHVGGNTSAFLPRARRLVDEQLHRWTAGDGLVHVVSEGHVH